MQTRACTSQASESARVQRSQRFYRNRARPHLVKSTGQHTGHTLRVMSHDSTSKAGQELAARGERGRLVAGTPSLNPHGRPKRGQTLAEQWRRETDWPKLRARLEEIALDPKSKGADAVAAIRELADRAWGKPLSTTELRLQTGNADNDGQPERAKVLARLSPAALREWLDAHDTERELLEIDTAGAIDVAPAATPGSAP